ncbi:MAG: hypothetical protein KDE30_04805, partial [Novosphingobium sp.]|nr:hypothetical protein [Novosphingobium sp.]
WNSFGGFDYWMSRTRNVEYLSQMGDVTEITAWMDRFPLWAQVGYGLGIWGSVAGSVLLLMRSRHAASAFLVSLVGAVVSFTGQWMNPVPPSLDTTAGKIMPFVVLAVIVFLWRFSTREAAKGTLR